MSRELCFLLILFSSLLGGRASAQVKPYFLVVMDTSGSMSWCNGGQNDCSCLNNNTCFGTGTVPANSAFRPSARCPSFSSNRIGGAKCALQRIIDGVGADATFALMQFQHTCSATCTNNVITGAGTGCGTTMGANFDDGQLLVSFGNNMREWVDGQCTGSCTNNYTRELTTGGWTPIGQSLVRANEWLRGTPQSGFLYPTNPAGFNVAPTSPLAGDPSLACRPVSVILLTDGDESCGGNPQTAAAALFGGGNIRDTSIATKAFRTYVIGFGSGGDFNATVLNQVAAAGGTGSYLPATNEEELSAALADIVAESIPIELCNSLDDDCDGKIDEGLPSGQPGTAAQPQALFCDGEARRTDAQNTQVRLHPDHSDTLARTTAVTSQVVCGRVQDTCSHAGFDDDCDGALDEDATNKTTCGTCPGATDICDGIDNDCDGVFDETPGSGRPFSVCPTTCGADVPCGSAIGECQSGLYKCTSGVLDTTTCVGQIGPTTEVCDELDNNCNGVVDDPAVLQRACNPPWGSTGICIPGTQFCAKPSEGELEDANGYQVDSSGQPVCRGEKRPEDRELCDSLDHDCDGNPFTCTRSSCVVGPQPVGVGDACGQGVGSCRGTLDCDTTATPPTLVCNAPGGSPELCDGLDNDCDGAVDENLGAGGPCGSGVGECRPGTYACAGDGTQVCLGGVEPIGEVCDALDNDCDGKTDENLGLGETCGSEEGACAPGKLTCSSGRTVCSGEIGPQLETCDCADNDCDGKIDEGSGDDPVCPGQSVCTMCQCALPCVAGEEFMAQCPQGKAAITDDKGCFCVGERCNDTSCRRQSLTVNDELQCAPNSDQLGPCSCKNNECTFQCSGVQCGDGLICDPTDGRCRQSSCLLPQFACQSNERCALQDGVFQCSEDPCAFRVCEGGDACRDGSCVGSCASVSCAGGERCVDGACQPDRCAGVTCATPGEVCDPSGGSCVPAGACARSGCPDGNTCDAVSGECVEDVCLRTRCATGELCNSATGQCERRCSGDQVFCDGACINPASNRRYCGASSDCLGDNAGERCGTGLVCSVGACSGSCAEGLVDCDGECIDPSRDPLHCGASGDCGERRSGEVCAAGESCTGGQCRAPAMPEGPKPDGRGIVAAGGGGCACSVGPGSAPGAGSAAGRFAFLLLGLGLWGLWLRRREALARRLGRWPGKHLVLLLGIVSAGLLDSGCKNNAFCLNCPSADSGAKIDTGIGVRPDSGLVEPPDSGPVGDGGSDIPDAAPDDGSVLRPDAACVDIELCNGLDDDCDGKSDEDADPVASNVDIQNDPRNCGACGKVCAIEHAYNRCNAGSCEIDRDQGDQGCDIGFHDLDADPANGCEYRCIKSAEDDSACNLVDNDCDGNIDEDVDPSNDPNNCGRCGLRCIFANASNGATCVDQSCVLDSTRCDPGFIDADGKSTTGCEYRCPVNPAVAETCNALDDDCDGTIDETIAPADDPRIGATCGSATGECAEGSYVCMNGAPTCDGSVLPVPETCDGLNNDCDGTTDEGFDLQTDLANCGSCGNGCLFNVGDGHATLVCQGGQCRVGACIGNFADSNDDYLDGCENACTITGNEVCDGVDNNCDGMIDNSVIAPDVVCAQRETGVCAASMATRTALRTLGPSCSSATLSCNPAAAAAMIPSFQATESLCDGLDNDCDGRTDEMIPAIGQPCSLGMGACRTTGVNVCDAGATGYRCGAATPPTGSAEVCDGLDNNCNGVIDDFTTPTASFSGFSLVDLGAANGNVLMMSYEASRPDANGTSAGRLTHKACSAAGRLPWADVTWGEANAACCALNTNGQCQAANKGWRLCDAATWGTACRGPAGTCTWGYSTQCSHVVTDTTTYNNYCLGVEGSVTCPSGVDKCATATGSAAYPNCRSVLTGGSIYDLSGNLKEWTYTAQGTGIYELRGGSFNNLETGRTCNFDFSVADTSFRFPTTGYRCCYYP